MHKSKTHFEQIPLETVKKIAAEFPEDHALGKTHDEGASRRERCRERCRELAKRVQPQQDPNRITGLVQQLTATFDEEPLRQRLRWTPNA